MNVRLIRTLAAGLAVAAALACGPALAEARRIASLGGSVTEIVVALGATDRLIARDTTSTFPDSIRALPDVGYVRALSSEGVLSVSPDLILVEEGAGPPQTLEVLRQSAVPMVVVPTARDAAGVVARIRAVAEALGLKEKGEELAVRVDGEIGAAKARSATVAKPLKALFVLSTQGGRIMAAGEGSSAEAILALAGAKNAMTGFQGYKPVSEEAIIAAQPDVIVMMNRSGSHSSSKDELFAKPAFSVTPAAKAGRLVTMDGLLMLGFGPRTGEAALTLHKAIYGE